MIVVFVVSLVQPFMTRWTATRQASLSFTISPMPSNHHILCRPFLPPSVFPSMRVFSNESAFRIRWPKYWGSASASVLPVNIHGWFLLGLTVILGIAVESKSGQTTLLSSLMTGICWLAGIAGKQLSISVVSFACFPLLDWIPFLPVLVLSGWK